MRVRFEKRQAAVFELPDDTPKAQLTKMAGALGAGWVLVSGTKRRGRPPKARTAALRQEQKRVRKLQKKAKKAAAKKGPAKKKLHWTQRPENAERARLVAANASARRHSKEPEAPGEAHYGEKIMTGGGSGS